MDLSNVFLQMPTEQAWVSRGQLQSAEQGSFVVHHGCRSCWARSTRC